MGLITNAPRGTNDVLPADVYKWHYIEQIMKEIVQCYGFKEIRTPTFEHTCLFQRGVGDDTDIVQKEMYTFEDKSNRSITLRPEGTAGVIRAAIEHGLVNAALPQKLYYFTNCFRYEKPQSGRLREFHQFGVELLGAMSPASDAEIILLCKCLITKLGIKAELQLNSIGCPTCRAEYLNALREYYADKKESLCPMCLTRLERNPMRLLDCKNSNCKSLLVDKTPKIISYFCGECHEGFEKTKAFLDTAKVEYTLNPRLVRGLDYYTNTVFEFIVHDIGAQGTICAGGRYNGLVAALGGPKTCGIGFAMGLERIILTMTARNCSFGECKPCEVYIASMDEKSHEKAFELTKSLRDGGMWAECDLAGRALNAQLKYADKIGARFSIILGTNELETNTAFIKNKQGAKTQITLNESFLQQVQTAVSSS
ncbi:MAG: histidine--tRNA ligase [Oscillospiraceae bacterium]|nr:histidine--tRNA ligase [Oscillospiraceae bacterium]